MIDKNKLNEVYEKYNGLKENNREKAVLYLLKNTKGFLKIGQYGCNARKEYDEEIKSWLQMDIVRAFDSYQPDKGASLWTWTYRLIVQSQYKFVQQKMSQNKKTCFDFSYQDCPQIYEAPINEPDPEETFIYKDDRERYCNDLNFILHAIFLDELEIEIYSRLNGVINYSKPQTIFEISEDTRLSEDTVKTIKKKCQNELFYFRKWLKEQELSFNDICYKDIIEYKNLRKKVTRKL